MGFGTTEGVPFQNRGFERADEHFQRAALHFLSLAGIHEMARRAVKACTQNASSRVCYYRVFVLRPWIVPIFSGLQRK